MNTFTLPLGFDAHTHQREGAFMETVLPYMVQTFPDFLAMPNLEKEPLHFGSQAIGYKQALIEAAEKKGLPCRPLVTIKYDSKHTTPETIRKAKSLGVTAIKFYPDGVTTNSAGGVRDFDATYPILEAAQDCDFMVLWHGEHPDKEVLDREPAFLDFFEKAVSDFPSLKQVLEHLSTWQAVQCIKRISKPNVGATITAHHLYWTLTDMAGGLFKSHMMCKPIIKNDRDREALRGAAMGNNDQFFFGSDSAPHPISKKHCGDVCSGVFTAPYSLSMLAEVFEQHRKLDKLGDFVSRRGRQFYGLPQPTEMTTLMEYPWIGPDQFGEGQYAIGNAAKGIRFKWKVAQD